MRLLIILISLTALALTSGCLRDTKKDDGPKDDTPKADASYPEGYRTWKKLNSETVTRPDDGIAREVYGKVLEGLGQGTLLVKEEYSLSGGAKGDLKHIAVMKRTGASTAANNGWEFSAYDANTKKKLAKDTAACVGCHTLQAENDYIFTDKSAF